MLAELAHQQFDLHGLLVARAVVVHAAAVLAFQFSKIILGHTNRLAGADSEVRTPDLQFTKLLLYQLS